MSATVDQIERWIAQQIASRLGTSVEQVDVELPWEELGLESSEALMLTGELEAWLGIEIDTTALWHYPTIGELSRFVAEEQQDRVGSS